MENVENKENKENKENTKKVVSAGGVVLWKHDNDIFICIVKRMI